MSYGIPWISSSRAVGERMQTLVMFRGVAMILELGRQGRPQIAVCLQQ